MRHPTVSLTDAQIATFRRQGWLVLRQVLDPDFVAELQRWVAQVSSWPLVDGPGLHHFEQTDTGPRIARSEDIIPHHPGLRAFLTDGTLIAQVSQLLGEPGVLFKEKVNYKHPGGGGFAPHQDATAYRQADHHISVMVPLDPATEASGCLYVAPGFAQGVLPAERGRIDEAVAAGLDWRAAEVHPGDLLWFDSYTPHYSETNRTEHPRRALYLTYNAASKGDHRDTYYADKRAEFAREGGDFEGERVRISINDDFLGRPVAGGATRLPLEDLLDRFDGPLAQRTYDEAVTELAHGLQAGALAAEEGAGDALVAAALLHDVGHLLVGDLFDLDTELEKDFVHEEVGARYLAKWFGPEVTEPVRLHVAAKRYLVATDPDYAATLTPSSVRSLAVQGGPMSEAEQEAFRALEGWEDALAVRRWDDRAKVPGKGVPPMGAYHDLLRGLARA